MFTGIIEGEGIIASLKKEGGNIQLSLRCPFTSELKIDQSLSHNGVCLTVISVDKDIYQVTAIEETLKRTNLGSLKPNDLINLERCMKLGDRLDGHLVQGHVDQTGTCKTIEEQQGSWVFGFEYDTSKGNITVEKGSICVNGVSLTVVDSSEGYFSVAIIPYTYQHTNFRTLKAGDKVNLEFDILGKYAAKLLRKQYSA